VAIGFAGQPDLEYLLHNVDTGGGVEHEQHRAAEQDPGLGVEGGVGYP
jgi:hypothetical protein